MHAYAYAVRSLLVIACLTMLIYVKAFLFYYAVAAQSVCLLYYGKEYHADAECEYCHCRRTEQLNAEACLHAIDGWVAKHTCKDSAEETTYAMNRYGTYWIVYLANLIDERYRETHDDAD